MKRFLMLVVVILSMAALVACMTHVPRPIVIEKTVSSE